jgi:hypothetical protein
LALRLDTRALASSAWRPVPQGKDLVVLLVFLVPPVRGILARTGQIKVICRVLLLRPLGRGLFHEIAEGLGEPFDAGVEIDFDLGDLLFLRRRGVVAH